MSPSSSSTVASPSAEVWDGRVLDERHVGLIESARGEAVLYVRNFYKSEDLFLDMFEDEYREMKVGIFAAIFVAILWDNTCLTIIVIRVVQLNILYYCW